MLVPSKYRAPANVANYYLKKIGGQIARKVAVAAGAKVGSMVKRKVGAHFGPSTTAPNMGYGGTKRRRGKYGRGKMVRRVNRKKLKTGRLSKVAKRQVVRLARKAVHGDRPIGKVNLNCIYNLPCVQGSPSTPLQNVVNELKFGSTTGYANAKMVVGNYTKIIDAISIMFNGKTAAIPYTTTGDLSPGGMIIPDFKHDIYYEFCNNSPVNQFFLIYEVTPKEDTTSDVYTTWTACNNTQVGGSTRAVTFFGNRPEYYSQFRDQYTILKKKSVIIAPGRRFSYHMGVSSAHLKLDDWLPVGSLTPTIYRKGWTKELLIINWNQPVYGQSAVSSFMGGTWNVPDSSVFGVGVEAKEYFKARLPDNLNPANYNKDNVWCVYSKYADDVGADTNKTLNTPALSAYAVGQ